MIFDDPDNSQCSPKNIERQKRDKAVHIDSDHKCLQVQSHHTLPTDWRKKLLNCRICKRSLCAYLSLEMLKLIQSKLKDNQTFITAGGFLDEYRKQCWCVRKNSVPQPLPYLRSNAEETDLRIWLHSINSIGSRKLLYSPDTDVYNIGLPLVQQQAALDVCLQLNGRRKQSHHYLYMNRFIQL